MRNLITEPFPITKFHLSSDNSSLLRYNFTSFLFIDPGGNWKSSNLYSNVVFVVIYLLVYPASRILLPTLTIVLKLAGSCTPGVVVNYKMYYFHLL